MAAKQEDVKNIIRDLLREDLGTVKSKTIYRDNLEIRITRDDAGAIKFDLPDQGKSYVLMSGRLYERQFNQGNAEPDKPEKEPGKQESIPVMETREFPAFAEQLSYKGQIERVDTSIYKNRLVCGCGQVRFVKSSDLFQVHHCKPCAAKSRRERRKNNHKRTTHESAQNVVRT